MLITSLISRYVCVFFTYLSAQQISRSAILPVHFIAFVIEYLLEDTSLCPLFNT